MQLVDVFRARVIDVAPDSLVVEITGTEDKVDGLLEILRPYGVLEVARTGRVTMAEARLPRIGGQAAAAGRCSKRRRAARSACSV